MTARRLVAVGIIGMIVAGLYMLHSDLKIRIIPSEAKPYVQLYDHPKPGLESALAGGDGQAYGAIARDPTMSRTNVFRDGKAGAAYRWQRPLLGYAAWVASGGQSGLEPGAQAVLVILGVGVAVAAVAALLAQRNVSPWFALLVLTVPGMMSSIRGLTPEAWALALVALAVLAWYGPVFHPALGSAALILAVLARESMLVAVIAMIGYALFRRLNEGRRIALVALMAPFVAYGTWALLLRIRIGAWPIDAHGGRLSGIPLSGLADSASKTAGMLMWLLIGEVLVAVALICARDDPLTPIVASYGVFALFLGPLVWVSSENYGRVLIPLYSFGAVLALKVVVGWLHANSSELARHQQQ